MKMRLYHLHEMRGMDKKDCVVIDPDYYAARQRQFFRDVLLDPPLPVATWTLQSWQKWQC